MEKNKRDIKVKGKSDEEAVGRVRCEMRVNVTFYLDSNLLKNIDEVRGLIPRSRFVEKLFVEKSLLEVGEESEVHKKSGKRAKFTRSQMKRPWWRVRYKMKRVKITITLDSNSVKNIDEVRGLIPRATFVEKLLVEAWEESEVHKKREGLRYIF